MRPGKLYTQYRFMRFGKLCTYLAHQAGDAVNVPRSCRWENCARTSLMRLGCCARTSLMRLEKLCTYLAQEAGEAVHVVQAHEVGEAVHVYRS